LFLKVKQQRGGESDGAEEVGGDDGFGVRGIGAGEEVFRAHDAGVVDDDVERREVGGEFLSECLDGGGIFDVESGRGDAGVGLGGLVEDLLTTAGDDDFIAELVECLCEAAADAGAAAGDEDGVATGFHESSPGLAVAGQISTACSKVMEPVFTEVKRNCVIELSGNWMWTRVKGFQRRDVTEVRRFWHTCGMVRVGGFGLRWLSAACGLGTLLWVPGLAWACCGTLLQAQEQTPQKNEPIHTLHVYTNLVQVPTVVLGPNRDRIKRTIPENRFSVSIDSGPWFPATHVRQEGDDAISLSILLDVSGHGADLMPKMADAIAGLSPTMLHAKDHVSIYALDCSLIRSTNDVPADSESLRTGVNAVLQSWMLRKQNKTEKSCKQSIHLWDSLAYVINELYRLPGRRVVLVVSDGEDQESLHKWNEVREFAQATGSAVFGMSYVPAYATDLRSRFIVRTTESPFLSVCELSGGMIFTTSTTSLQKMLEQFVRTVRERYIVEFPRPSNSTPGAHGMEVKIAGGGGDFIRSAGVSMPIPDPKVAADPTTVSAGPSRAPEQGTRREMKPQ
jgi:hypothetical protein